MTFVLALLVFMAIVAAMAVGVIFGRAPIKGPAVALGQSVLTRIARSVAVTPNAAKATWSQHPCGNTTRIRMVAERSGIAFRRT